MSCGRRAIFSAVKRATILSLWEAQRWRFRMILRISKPYMAEAVSAMVPMNGANEYKYLQAQGLN